MVIPKKQLGAGAMICAAVLLMFLLPSDSERSMKLPNGRVISFDGIALGTNLYHYDGRAILAMRHLLPPKWLEVLRIGPPPALELFNATYQGIFQASEDFIVMSFSWHGREPMSFQESWGNRFVQLLVAEKSYLSRTANFQSQNDRGYFSVGFTNGTPLSDVLHLRLISGHEGKTNDWVVLGEMRVKNPVPRDKRPSKLQ